MTATRIPSAQNLSAVQLHQLHADLHEQRGFRLAQIAELEAAAVADPSDDIARSEISELLLQGARLALAEIHAALERVADGRYGRCTSCDQPIAVERLEILPMAALCMRCQRHQETAKNRDRGTVP